MELKFLWNCLCGSSNEKSNDYSLQDVIVIDTNVQKIYPDLEEECRGRIYDPDLGEYRNYSIFKQENVMGEHIENKFIDCENKEEAYCKAKDYSLGKEPLFNYAKKSLSYCESFIHQI